MIWEADTVRAPVKRTIKDCDVGQMDNTAGSDTFITSSPYQMLDEMTLFFNHVCYFFNNGCVVRMFM